MNRRQKFILVLGSFLIIIHLILYFLNIQEKYEKLQIEKRKLETNYSQPLLEAVRGKEDTYKRVFLAWLVVSMFLMSAVGLSLWLYREKQHK